MNNSEININTHMETKTCTSKHHEGDREVDVNNFAKHKNTADGLQTTCKNCMKIAQRQWTRNNPEAAKRANQKCSKARWQRLKDEHPEKIIINSVRNRAKKLGYDFDLLEEDIQIPPTCPILGIPLFSSEKRTDNSPSIDRIDSSKGYTKDNIVIISWRANRIKNDGTAEEHRLIYEFLSKIQR